MKKIFIIILTTLLIVSCNEWFDVRPSSEITDSEMFSKEQGFYRALIGTYIGMTNGSIYGRELTYGAIEILSQSFTPVSSTDTKYTSLLEYKYNDDFAKPVYESTFAQAYTVIANINYLLANVEGQESMFPEHYYEMIVAEMKALRAYLHFDLLRLFAPSPTAADKNVKAIPYADSYIRGGHKQLTLGEVLSNIKEDLIEASNILKIHDPYFYMEDVGEESSAYVPINQALKDGGFSYSRRSRMNYYAINALLARIYLYEGDYQNALDKAKIPIESELFPIESFTSTDAIGRKGLVFFLYDVNLSVKSAEVFSQSSRHRFSIPDYYLSYLFEEDVYELTDFRRIHQFSSRDLEMAVFLNKYFYFGTNSSLATIPMIRISEMYYIASEAAFKLGYQAEALDYINFVRKKLIGKTPENELSIENFSNPNFNFEKEIEKEYKKEFLGEGQLFYYFKRLNRTVFTGINGREVKISDYPNVYVLPIPEREIEYGQIK